MAVAPSFVDWGRVRRVHIIGGPGAGKTTLSRRLGETLNLPVYALDNVAFEGPRFLDRSLSERSLKATRIAAQEGWVCEGIFVDWADPLTRRAEVVVWLDQVSWPEAARNIMKRFVTLAFSEARKRRGLARITRFPDYARHLGQLWSVLHTSRAFWTAPAASRGQTYPSSRAAIGGLLEPYAAKTIHCRTHEDVAELYAAAGISRETPVAELRVRGA